MSAGRVRILVVVAVLIAAVTIFLLRLRDRAADDGAITASGTVEATTADIGFAAGGRVERLLVDEGDVVAEGQELATLDRAELQARRSMVAAQVDAARAQHQELRQGPRPEDIAQARAARAASTSRLEDATRDAERTRRLFAGGAVSREALDKAETQLTVLTAQRTQADEALRALERGTRAERIAASAAQLQQAEAAVLQTDALLENAVARAPFPGVVTVRHREPGETVPAGAPVVTVMNPDDRWVRIYVGETDVARVSVGAGALISVDGYPGQTFAGRILHIASEAEFTPRNVQTPEERTKLVYAVRVRITDDPGQHLKPGLPVDVRIAPATVPPSSP